MARKTSGLCPRCGAPWSTKRGTDGLYPALSRRDNATNICPECGVKEALEDAGITRPYSGPVYWKARREEKAR